MKNMVECQKEYTKDNVLYDGEFDFDIDFSVWEKSPFRKVCFSCVAVGFAIIAAVGFKFIQD